MSKLSDYQELLQPMMIQGDDTALQSYLLANSNLPSQQGNLTLAAAFASQFHYQVNIKQFTSLLKKWARIASGDNEPALFLPFCAIQAIGCCYAYTKDETYLPYLKEAMRDQRWRMREGIAIAFQHIGEADGEELKRLLTAFYPSSSYLDKRAFVAALAHPPILKKNKDIALFALTMSGHILQDVYAQAVDRKDTDYIALVKGLSYAISVFVAYAPEEGFAWMERWVAIEHKDCRKIIKENLNKSRIKKPFPTQCANISSLL